MRLSFYSVATTITALAAQNYQVARAVKIESLATEPMGGYTETFDDDLQLA